MLDSPGKIQNTWRTDQRVRTLSLQIFALLERFLERFLLHSIQSLGRWQGGSGGTREMLQQTSSSTSVCNGLPVRSSAGNSWLVQSLMFSVQLFLRRRPFWHGQERRLFDVVHPACLLPPTASASLKIP